MNVWKRHDTIRFCATILCSLPAFADVRNVVRVSVARADVGTSGCIRTTGFYPF